MSLFGLFTLFVAAALAFAGLWPVGLAFFVGTLWGQFWTCYRYVKNGNKL